MLAARCHPTSRRTFQLNILMLSGIMNHVVWGKDYVVWVSDSGHLFSNVYN